MTSPFKKAKGYTDGHVKNAQWDWVTIFWWVLVIKKNNNYLMIVVVQNNNERKDMIITKIKNWERSSVTVFGVIIMFATSVTMENRCILNGLLNSWEGNVMNRYRNMTFWVNVVLTRSLSKTHMTVTNILITYAILNSHL